MVKKKQYSTGVEHILLLEYQGKIMITAHPQTLLAQFKPPAQLGLLLIPMEPTTTSAPLSATAGPVRKSPSPLDPQLHHVLLPLPSPQLSWQ